VYPSNESASEQLVVCSMWIVGGDAGFGVDVKVGIGLGMTSPRMSTKNNESCFNQTLVE